MSSVLVRSKGLRQTFGLLTVTNLRRCQAQLIFAPCLKSHSWIVILSENLAGELRRMEVIVLCLVFAS